jgi:hypothetical protein
MSIARAKYKDMTKKERKKEQILGGGGLLQQKQRNYLKIFITSQFDTIKRS